MRAVAGFVDPGADLDEDAAKRRLRALIATGAEAESGCWHTTDVGLVQTHCRYFPTEEHERQPLRSRDGSVVFVIDAALDNRTDLILLFGVPPEQHEITSDRMLVQRAYEAHGPSGLNLLEGKFAFAAWHLRERRLVCATDHFSFRPIYYIRFGKGFAFATTVRGLMTLPGLSRDLQPRVVVDYLLGGTSPAGLTLFRDVRILPAAHWLSFDETGVRLNRYWRPSVETVLRLRCDEEYQEAFNAEYERAIAAALRPDGNIAVLVSGGLDSAALTAKAGKMLAQQGRRLQAIHYLTSSRDGRGVEFRETDESHYVRLLQQSLPEADFHFIAQPPVSRHVSLEALEQRYALDWAPLRGVILAKAESDEDPSVRLPPIKRRLDGLGGNALVSPEAYAGPYFAELAVTLQWRRLLQELRGHRDFYGCPIRRVVRQKILDPLFDQIRSPPPDHRRGLVGQYLNPDFVRRTGLSELIQRPENNRHWRQDFSVRQQMAWALEFDMSQNASAMGSVFMPGQTSDSYSPYLNRRLNEFCLSLPIEQQIRGGRDRLLLRRAMRGLLPDEVAWRITRGYPQPRSGSAAQALRAVLPEAFAAMEHSQSVQACLDWPRVRHDFLRDFDGMLRRIGAIRTRNLFNLAWFLRWLERRPPP